MANASTEQVGVLEKVIRAALQVDGNAALAAAQAARAACPGASNAALAARFFRTASWKGALIGGVSGLPANVAAAIPAAILDAAAVLRLELEATARVAALYDPRCLEDGSEPWELVVPIIGANVVSQALRELGIAAASQLSRAAIRAILRKEGLAVFRRAVLKAFGAKITQRALMTKTVPVVGGLVGGGWNLGEIRLVGNRVIAFFEAEGLVLAPAAAVA